MGKCDVLKQCYCEYPNSIFTAAAGFAARAVRIRLAVSVRFRQACNLPLASDEIEHIAGLEIGADDCVTKPFSPRELVARIRVILRRAGTKIGTREAGMTIAAAAATSASWFELRALEACVLFQGVAIGPDAHGGLASGGQGWPFFCGPSCHARKILINW